MKRLLTNSISIYILIRCKLINGDVFIHILAAYEGIVEHIGYSQEIDKVTWHVSKDICKEILNYWQYTTTYHHHHKDARSLSCVFSKAFCSKVENRPHSTSNKAVIGTVVDVMVPSRMEINGMLTVTLLGVKIAAKIRIMQAKVAMSISWREETFPAMKLEQSLPTSIRSQYIAATAPPIVAALRTESGFSHAPLAVVSDK